LSGIFKGLSQVLIKHHAMKTYSGSSFQLGVARGANNSTPQKKWRALELAGSCEQGNEPSSYCEWL